MECNSNEIQIMDKRRAELSDLSSYIQSIESDVTMILQSLQWDRKHLIEAIPMTSCKYDNNHRVPLDRLEDHEKHCHLRSLDYSEEELLLPDPPDANAATLVKLDSGDIANIIEYAVKVDPVFRKGRGPGTALPLSLGRLQQGYSADERRAIHDAVVSAVPACHDLLGLALLGDNGEAQSSKQQSRAEILSQLRDMRRRRTKYRGAAKTRNYSAALRDLIATQMEHFSVAEDNNHTNNSENNSKPKIDKQKLLTEEHIKKEPLDQSQTSSAGKETNRYSSKDYEIHDRNRSNDNLRQRYNARDEARRTDRGRDKYKEREKSYDDYKRDKHRDDRRYRDDRNRQSSASKERNRDKKDYRSSDKFREDRDLKREDTYYKSSRDSESRHKRDDYDQHDRSHRREKHKRYYDSNPDEILTLRKRIKKEKTE